MDFELWTCLECWTDQQGPLTRCPVCYEPLCHRCHHQHTRAEIRYARFMAIDKWLQWFYLNHPFYFWLSAVGVACLVFIPIAQLIEWSSR